MGPLFKDGAKALTKRQLMVGMGKAFGKAAAAEVPTELADYVLGDVAAKVTYAPDTEMFTPEKLHEMGVIAIATALSAGAVGAGGKGFMSVRGKRGGKIGAGGKGFTSVRGKHGGEIGPDGVEYVQTPGEMAQGVQAEDGATGDTATPEGAAQGEADAATQTSKEDAAISSALDGDTGIGVIWQPEGNTPGASAQDIAILKQQTTKEDGTLDEQAIVGLCENEDVGLILLDAVKGDEQARKEYNMLLAGEDAKGMSEITEEEMDEIAVEEQPDEGIDLDNARASLFNLLSPFELACMDAYLYTGSGTGAAEILGWPPKKVENALTRIRRKARLLREAL